MIIVLYSVFLGGRFRVQSYPESWDLDIYLPMIIIPTLQVNQFLRQQGMRKDQVEHEMERAYEQYFSSLASKVTRDRYCSFPPPPSFQVNFSHDGRVGRKTSPRKFLEFITKKDAFLRTLSPFFM